MWSPHVQPQPRIERLCEDGMRGVENEFGKKNLIRSFVDLEHISNCLRNWNVRSLLESDTWSRVMWLRNYGIDYGEAVSVRQLRISSTNL